VVVARTRGRAPAARALDLGPHLQAGDLAAAAVAADAPAARPGPAEAAVAEPAKSSPPGPDLGLVSAR
jgi:hypothetical protein